MRVEVSESANTRLNMNLSSRRGDHKHVFLLTHRTKKGLLNLAQALTQYIEGKRVIPEGGFLEDLAHTLGSCRTRFDWRLALTATSQEELLCALTPQQLEPRRALNEPRIGFIFTGQGAQWYAMGLELVHQFKSFENTLLNADAHFKSLGASWSLIGEWHPEFCC